MKAVSYSILDDIRNVLAQTDERDLFRLLDNLLDAGRIFVAGTARGMDIARSFALRLTQLAMQVHVIGDATTPAIRKGDLLVLFLSIPESRRMADYAKKAYQQQAATAVFTPVRSTPVVDLADIVIEIPRPSVRSGIPALQTSGVIFDQTCFILSDTLIHQLSTRLKRTTQELLENRSNLD